MGELALMRMALWEKHLGASQSGTFRMTFNSEVNKQKVAHVQIEGCSALMDAADKNRCSLWSIVTVAIYKQIHLQASHHSSNYSRPLNTATQSIRLSPCPKVP